MIYFMQPTDGGPVKIGYSADVPTRLRQLEAHYGRPLAILATMDGGQAEEAEIHARFAHLRLSRAEQFRPAPELAEFIEHIMRRDARLPGIGSRLFVDQDSNVVEIMEPMAPLSVKLHMDVIESARIVAAIRNVSMTDMLSDMLRPHLVEMEREELSKRTAATNPVPKRPGGKL